MRPRGRGLVHMSLHERIHRRGISRWRAQQVIHLAVREVFRQHLHRDPQRLSAINHRAGTVVVSAAGQRLASAH